MFTSEHTKLMKQLSMDAGLTNEFWKRCPIYPEYYVSSEGRVYSVRSKKLMTPHLNSDGYIDVCIKTKKVKTKRLVHQLVLRTFDPRSEEEIKEQKLQIDHLNTNRTDNRLSNLRWRTVKENANNPLSVIHRINVKFKYYDTPVLHIYIGEDGQRYVEQFKSVYHGARGTGQRMKDVGDILRSEIPLQDKEWIWESEYEEWHTSVASVSNQ